MKETWWHANGMAAVEGMQSGKPQLVLHMMFQDLQHGFCSIFFHPIDERETNPYDNP